MFILKASTRVSREGRWPQQLQGLPQVWQLPSFQCPSLTFSFCPFCLSRTLISEAAKACACVFFHRVCLCLCPGPSRGRRACPGGRAPVLGRQGGRRGGHLGDHLGDHRCGRPADHLVGHLGGRRGDHRRGRHGDNRRGRHGDHLGDHLGGHLGGRRRGHLDVHLDGHPRGRPGDRRDVLAPSARDLDAPFPSRDLLRCHVPLVADWVGGARGRVVPPRAPSPAPAPLPEPAPLHRRRPRAHPQSPPPALTGAAPAWWRPRASSAWGCAARRCRTESPW
mmetsp:Transcript_10270/g.19422  ORF Transcript_10270/g.19422 Transcript_10270/m.19422 type:complete len:279 (+) Transcript_10270:231-1067(+)